MTELLDLKFLYYFSCETMDVLEVKVQGLADDTPIGRVYHWLYYDRVGEQMHKFGFMAMGKEGDKGLRSFDEGSLWFDTSEAGLTLDDGHAYELVLRAVDKIPESLVSQVQAFLKLELDD